MDREETKEIIKTIATIYPGFYKGASREDKAYVIDLWASLFTEESSELVSAALKSFISADTKGFAPSPGQIKEKIRIIMQPKQMTEQEAWQLVYKAIRSTGNMEQAVKQHEKLPMAIKGMLSPAQLKEWAFSDIDSIQTVVASNFMRSFRDRKNQILQYQALPGEVKKAIEGFTSNKQLEGEM